jgi:hypothetical protein
VTVVSTFICVTSLSSEHRSKTAAKWTSTLKLMNQNDNGAAVLAAPSFET